MPGYVEWLLLKFKHKTPDTPQHSPYCPPLKVYGAAAQDIIPDDRTKRFNARRIKLVKQVVGGALCYAHIVDDTLVTALVSIASEQTKVMQNTAKKIK